MITSSSGILASLHVTHFNLMQVWYGARMKFDEKPQRFPAEPYRFETKCIYIGTPLIVSHSSKLYVPTYLGILSIFRNPACVIPCSHLGRKAETI